MIPDCSSHIGATHSICQDYARWGTDKEDKPFVVVADGCSGEADTDIGARLLVLSAAQELIYPMDPSGNLTNLYDVIIKVSSNRAKSLGLSDSSLAATLLMLKMDKESVLASIYGDGMLVYKKKDGTIKVRQMFFPKSIPLYPSYILFPDIKHEFDGQLRSYDILPDGSVSEEFSIPFSQKFYFEAIEPDIDYVAILTDGVMSFQQMVDKQTSKVQEPIDAKDVLRDLLKFKNFAPGFVGRRVKRFLKDAAEKHWQHHDDFTMGALAK